LASFCEAGLFRPRYGVRIVVLAEVALVAQDDQAAGGQLADDAPDPGRGQVMHRAGQRAGHPYHIPVGAGDPVDGN